MNNKNTAVPIESAEVSSSSGLRIFMIIAALVGISMAFSDALFSNYFKEAYQVSAEQRGLIEFPREMPGIIALFIIGALVSLKNVKTAIISKALAGIGIAVLGFWRPNFAVMCVFLFIHSLGTHMYMPLGDSIALAISRGRDMGKTLGRINSVRMASVMCAGLVTFAGFRYGLFNFETPVLVFLLAALVFVLTAIFLWILRKKDPAVDEEAPVNAKFVFRKAYIRYYIVCALFGGRKQIMIVYSPWVLIELLGFRADTMSMLAVIGSFIGVFFMRLVGRCIDKFGVRKVMMAEALAFIGIYTAYGLLSRWLNTSAVAVSMVIVGLVYLLNIVDRMTAQFGMVRSIYMKSIAIAPGDVTPSLSLGMSIDHVLAIAGAAVCGIIWQNFGPEYVFILAGAMSLGNLIVARGIKIDIKD